MSSIKIIDSGLVYENELPQLRSRHGYFPEATELPDGRWMVSFVLCEALESVDGTTVTAISDNKGKTWTYGMPIYNKSNDTVPTSNILKVSWTGGKRISAFGHRYLRYDPDVPVGNPANGGVLPNDIIYVESNDLGETWGEPRIIPRTFASPAEAMSSIYVLKDGTWITPVANFFNWDGKCPEGLQGRLVRSVNCGKTWDDTTVTMKFDGDITVWEQRVCQLEDGRVVLMAWNEDMHKGGLPNHYVISYDNGKSFNSPRSTGILGQASFINHISGSKILALHCLRKYTERPGIYAYIIDLSDDKWNIVYEDVLWEPAYHIANNKMAAAFAFLKFGQPSAIKLSDGDFLMVNWFIHDGQAKIAWRKLRIEL